MGENVNEKYRLGSRKTVSLIERKKEVAIPHPVCTLHCPEAMHALVAKCNQYHNDHSLNGKTRKKEEEKKNI